jgi:hypothetical protein
LSENKATETPRKTKIASFRIGKGVKKPAGPAFTMTSEYVEVEVKLPEGATENDFQAEFTAAEYIIDNLLQAPQVAALTEATGKGTKTFSWDPSKIRWEEAEGFKGRYERTEDINNTEYKAMLKDLAEHKGDLWREGYYYWVFQNGATVGRKKKEKKAKE